MDHSTRNRFSTWVILLLVILNAVLIGLLWYEHFSKPPRPTVHSQADRDAFFAKELQLDPQQADSVRKLREEHFRHKDSLRFEISRLGRQMIDELFAAEPDSLVVRRLSDDIGLLQAEMEMGVYEHFNEIKRLCRPEQHERLKHLIFNAIQSRQPPPPGGGDRPPPPGAPPPPRGR